MKKKYSYKAGDKTITREYNYIPVRYIIAILLTIFDIFAIIGIVAVLCYYVPYFYIAAMITQIVCVLTIISSDDNPDYKAPWLLFVLVLPIAGFMLYFLFYSRKLKKKYVRRLSELKRYEYEKDDIPALTKLYETEPMAASSARMIAEIADTHIFTNTKQTYFPAGEKMMDSILKDLETAKSFIFLEFFIIEEGRFWNSILDILKRKVSEGVTVRVIYDDVGCMKTLPGNYCSVLRKMGIEATAFSRLKGNADSEFNNRNHRKILVIDGVIGYTGGVNIADEYINEVVRFGHWKDTGLRIEGEAVFELTQLFLNDYGINVKTLPENNFELFPKRNAEHAPGYVIPFGDGPRPLYERSIGKIVIQNMLGSAIHYMYMTTPYLIIDNDLCASIEGAALRGVDVRIIVPHIPDKKLVFSISRSFYKRLIDAGVKIHEYKPGFIHAKSYIADDKYAMVGTINLDYRSLVHHFENGVWMYGTESIAPLKDDILDTLGKSIEIKPDMIKANALVRFIRAIVRIFAPML